jgi:hypothetical protein
MEGWASPELEVIAYRAESTVEVGEAGGAAHPVVLRVALPLQARTMRRRHQAEALNANQMGLAPTGYPAHKSIRGVHFTMLNRPQFVYVLVTYAALDRVEALAAGGDYVARFTRHRDRFDREQQVRAGAGGGCRINNGAAG